MKIEVDIIKVAASMRSKVTKRVSASLPDAAMEKLKLWASIEGTSISDLVGYLLRRAIDEAEEQGKFKKPKSTNTQ